MAISSTVLILLTPITESINDFDVIDVRDSVPDIAETIHMIPEALIMLLFDGLHGFSSERTLVCVL
jgi:hypothetical protein